MKTHEQSDQFFTPLDQTECSRIRGGIVPLILGAFFTAAVTEIISDWDNFKAGLLGQPEIHYR